MRNPWQLSLVAIACLALASACGSDVKRGAGAGAGADGGAEGGGDGGTEVAGDAEGDGPGGGDDAGAPDGGADGEDPAGDQGAPDGGAADGGAEDGGAQGGNVDGGNPDGAPDGGGDDGDPAPACGDGQTLVDGVCQFDCQINCDPIDQGCGTCCLGQAGLSHKLGGACGLTPRCHPDVLGEEEFQLCLEDQCESQICLAGYCSQRCREDGDCADAQDGPVGDVFRCRVPAGQESGVCVPGSMQLCAASGDCEEDGESCILRGTGDGHVAGFCATNNKCGAGPGETCNDDPLEGEVSYCDSGLCSTRGTCLEICENDDHCSYSEALECGEPQRIFGDVPDEFSLCVGRLCTPGVAAGEEGGCPDDSWCGNLDWDADASILGFRCSQASLDPTAMALYDGECNNNDAFGPIVRCAEGLCNTRAWLNDRRCTLPCDAAADNACPEDYKCEPQWLGVEDDGQRFTRMITYDACIYAPGSDAICNADNDCEADNEACQIAIDIVVLDEDGNYQDEDGNRVSDGVDIDLILNGRCQPFEDGQLAGGEACEGAEDCQNGLCLNSGVCAGLCGDSGDCADGEVCSILRLDQDDVGFSWGFCTDWRGSGVDCAGGIDSCDGVEGAEDGELCLPNILVEPTENATDGVEWKCGASDGDGEAGDECQSFDDCESNLCVAGIENDERVGFCSAGCENDDDCPNLFSCAKEQFFQRSGPDVAVSPSVGNICKPWLECTLCNDNSYCPTGFQCNHMRDPDAEEEDVYVGVCLLSCADEAGEEDDSLCADTQLGGRITCRDARDELGDDIDGQFACAPRNLSSCFPQ